ncbi:MAG TPA: hypothetical protein VIM02_12380 [Rhizomicrobium sp.]|jgi:hypothetical protein
MDALAAALERSPELFPHSYDVAAEAISFIRLSEADYRQASFLDARILGRQSVGRAVSWPQLQAAVAASRLEEGCHFIFHIGHTGSTLLSRLLDAHPRVLGIREPMILRTFAQLGSDSAEGAKEPWPDDAFDARLGLFLKLWSRGFRADQQAVVKATSFVSELAPRILARPYRPRGIFLFVPPETYLATILAGPNSRQESKMLAPSRLVRLQRRIGAERWKLSPMSEGEMIAMSWICEMSALAAAARDSGERVMWLDFDRFLAELQAKLIAVFRHLGVDAGEVAAAQILSGPDLRRYAKATEHPYDPQLRRDLLDQARAEHRGEIARGMAWLNNAAREFAQIREAMATA